MVPVDTRLGGARGDMERLRNHRVCARSHLTALMKVSDRGGPVEPATLLDRARGDNSHRWPVFLPDGVHFLYFVRAEAEDRRGVYVGRVDRPASLARRAAVSVRIRGGVHAPRSRPGRSALRQERADRGPAV